MVGARPLDPAGDRSAGGAGHAVRWAARWKEQYQARLRDPLKREGSRRYRKGAENVPKRIKEAASEFLANRRVAVTGVSREPQNHGSNVVYRRLKERGYEVFAINPNADKLEGDPSYHDLRSIPGGVEAVVIGTRPEITEETMRECAELGIKHVWMHRGPGAGSVS